MPPAFIHAYFGDNKYVTLTPNKWLRLQADHLQILYNFWIISGRTDIDNIKIENEGWWIIYRYANK